MDRRGIFGDRRTTKRRARRPFWPVRANRRSGADRRLSSDRRAEASDRRNDRHRVVKASPRRTDWVALPPVSRLIPAVMVVVASLAVTYLLAR